MSGDRGSAIPLVLGLFLIAVLTVAGSVALGDAFVQQRELQAICDGAAAAAAASVGDLDRDPTMDAQQSLRFRDAGQAVDAYLARDPQRREVRVQAGLSADRETIIVRCEQTTSLALGALFGRARVRHIATSSARAAVTG